MRVKCSSIFFFLSLVVMSVVLQPQTSDNFYQSFVAPAWNGSSRRRKSEVKKNHRQRERERDTVSRGSYRSACGSYRRELIVHEASDHHHHYHKVQFVAPFSSMLEVRLPALSSKRTTTSLLLPFNGKPPAFDQLEKREEANDVLSLDSQ